MSDLSLPPDTNDASTPNLDVSSRDRAESYGDSISTGPYMVQDETRLSCHVFAQDAEQASRVGNNPMITAARIKACADMTVRFGKKAISNVYVSSPINSATPTL